MLPQALHNVDWIVLLGLTTLIASFVISLGSLVGSLVRAGKKQ